MVQALVVHPFDTGDLVEIAPDDIKTIVGGWLGIITGAGGPWQGLFRWHAYVNDDAAQQALPPNSFATYLAQLLGWRGDDSIYGTAVFLGDGPGGTEADVPEEVLQTQRRLIRRLESAKQLRGVIDGTDTEGTTT